MCTNRKAKAAHGRSTVERLDGGAFSASFLAHSVLWRWYGYTTMLTFRNHCPLCTPIYLASQFVRDSENGRWDNQADTAGGRPPYHGSRGKNTFLVSVGKMPTTAYQAGNHKQPTSSPQYISSHFPLRFFCQKETEDATLTSPETSPKVVFSRPHCTLVHKRIYACNHHSTLHNIQLTHHDVASRTSCETHAKEFAHERRESGSHATVHIEQCNVKWKSPSMGERYLYIGKR